MKIIFTGAQGTGKTTILNHYRDRFPVITEVVRDLAKTGLKINEMGDEEGQHTIFETYVDRLTNTPSYISDRGLTDVFAYTWFHHEVQNKISRDEISYESVTLLDFIEDNPDVIWCYFPIEFDVVDDGVRSTEEEFRHYIDRTIKELMDDAHIPYHTITGTVEERIKQVDEIIKNADSLVHE